MKYFKTWLSNYRESHQHITNKWIHILCIPMIFFGVFGLLGTLKLTWLEPNFTSEHISHLHYGNLLLFFVLIYCLLRTPSKIFVVMTLWTIGVNITHRFFLDNFMGNTILVYVLLIVIGVVLHHVGHKVERRVPAYKKNLLFILITPALGIFAFLKDLDLLDDSNAFDFEA